MIVLTADNANDLYAAACEVVREQGHLTHPRGLAATEVLGAHLCLSDPRRRFVHLPPARVINPAFAVAEAVWILSGSDDPWIFTYNRSLAQFADGGRLQGAYGPRLRRWRGRVDQLAHVRGLLMSDRDSRQAVVQLFDPELDTVGHRDVPCTLGYRFFIRAGRLHMHTSMRSNDLWLGFPYDLFTATVIQELLAHWLEVELGGYHHHVDSLHLYAQHLSSANFPKEQEQSPTMPRLAADWHHLSEILSSVITGEPSLDDGSIWTVFSGVLASYRAWTSGDRASARGMATAVDDELGRALVRWYDHLNASSAGAMRTPTSAGRTT